MSSFTGDSGVVFKIHPAYSSAAGSHRHDNLSPGTEYQCFIQGLQILLTSGVTVTSASQILESFWNIWSQVSQRKKPFSDFPARGPGMYTLS